MAHAATRDTALSFTLGGSHMRSTVASVALLAGLLAGCTFDASSLEDRACSTSNDCEGGAACVDGYCELVLIDGDVGGDDVDIPDPDISDDADLTDDTDAAEPDTDLSDTADADAGDISDPDADGGDDADTSDAADTADVVDPGCDGAAPFCDGTVAVVCLESGDEQRVDCDTCLSPLGCRCTDGSCAPRECGEGATRCLDGSPEACVDGEWQAPTDCTIDEVCIDGDCVPLECDAGAIYCDGDTIVTCGDDGFVASTFDCQGASGFCDAGECAAWACEPNSVACSDEQTLVVCDARGTGDSEVSCAFGEFCGDNSGVDACLPDVCVAGDVRCIDGVQREQCNEFGSGYFDVSDCAGATYCADGDCIPQLCAPTTSRCTSVTAFATCNSIGSGETPTDCPSDTYCSGGACVPDVCVASSTRCSNDTTLATCNISGSAEATSSCGGTTYCSGGACVADVCTASATRCIDPTTAAACNAAGSAESTTACAATSYCNGGACVPDVCTASAARCSNETTVATCNALGSAESSTTCDAAQYCLAGACVPDTCTASSTRCISETTLATCNTAGSGETNSSCSPSQFCSAGACIPDVCTAGATRCLPGNEVATCNATGSGETSAPCDADTTCTDGVCVGALCEPDSAICGDDGNSYVCNAAGTEYLPLETCGFGCDAGACVPARCGDGIVTAANGETCDDGNSRTCDGCEACVYRGGLAFVSGGERASGATWVPGTSSITIEAWVSATAPGLIAGVGSFAGDFASLYLTDTGRPGFGFTAGGTPITVEGPASITGTGYHHLAGVRFRQDGAMIFLDGKLVGIVYTEVTPQNIDNGALWVGVDPDATFPAIIGRVDEVRISNSARYSGHFTPARDTATDASTVAAWSFNETSGTLADDRSANNRDLTLSSAGARAADACFGAVSSVCGDGFLAPWEECDNALATCTASCTSTTTCDSQPGPVSGCFRTTATATSWTNAESACTTWGGQMAWVSNALENTWLTQVVYNGAGGSTWIGFNDRGTEGTWVWDGGAAVTYTNWATGEPNNVGNEDCATMEIPAANWVDRGCNNNYRYACRR